MIMHWPQICFIVYAAIELGFSLALSGKPKTGTYSFTVTVIAWGILYFFLYMGGFFGPV